MAGKVQLDWRVIKYAWQENFVSTRLFCRETGLDRSYLVDKIRDERWHVLRKPTIDSMKKHLEFLQWTNYGGRNPERVKDLQERIKDREVLMAMWLDLVRKTVADVRFRRMRRRA